MIQGIFRFAGGEGEPELAARFMMLMLLVLVVGIEEVNWPEYVGWLRRLGQEVLVGVVVDVGRWEEVVGSSQINVVVEY